MNTEKLFEGFENFQHGEYAEEAQSRWGETEAWKISAKRTKSYGKNEWTKIKAEANAINDDLVAAMQAGLPADSDRACQLAERHRQHIEQWFYPCPKTMHVNLGEMYVADERFAQHYDKAQDGLAAYLRAAIVANAAKP